MKLFLSSTFVDLVREREAVLKALRKKRQSVLAMEDFLATPSTPLDTGLRHLRESDLMLLVVGFKAGSLVPGKPGMTYTAAEYEEALQLGRHVLVFQRVTKRWPWSKRKEWMNREHSKDKRDALERFHGDVRSKWTLQSFSNPDELALAVIQSLDNWEAEGRPGVRKTFASADEFFASKTPRSTVPILDFSTTLFGRDKEIAELNDFLAHNSQSVCVLSGRGGIGKSKLLWDWTRSIRDSRVVFLKDEPLWHPDSEKEVPVGPVVLIVDDAHRSSSMGQVSRIFKDLRQRQSFKLVLSTRPGGVPSLTQQLYRDLDPSEVVVLPELQELERDQAARLAAEVLGESYSGYADILADVAGNTPLVIVAGGRLIASQKVSPARLSGLREFRDAIFTRFLDELQSEGPRFAINPPRPLLDVISAVGPINVQDKFLATAEKFLLRRADEILSTLDNLAAIGIVTSRTPGPIRILPDVLSDFVLEKRCVDDSSRSTRYADIVYDSFGETHFQNLMQNLSELDWRLGSRPYGLDLLSGIWEKVEREFLAADEYGRHNILEQLRPAAIYQPEHILRLIDLALDNPIPADADAESLGRLFRMGQRYVVEALPGLLEATAHHPEHIKKSVDLLWTLSKMPGMRANDSGSPQGVLKRLASYDRFGWPAFNFAMLLQAIRLSKLPDAFEWESTPFDLIEQLLEREGEYTEYSDNAVRFGGFGLNILGVGLLRGNVLDFLEYSLNSPTTALAVKAAQSLGGLLFSPLNRFGRQSSQTEIDWQNEESLRALRILAEHLPQSEVSIVRAQMYNAIRHATGTNFPDQVRQAAGAVLGNVELSDDLLVMDAVCTQVSDLPILSETEPADSWQEQHRRLMQSAHDRLALIDAPERGRLLIEKVKSALNAKVEARGFQDLMQTFAEDTSFLEALTDQLLTDGELDRLTPQLSIVLDRLHSYASEKFHARADAILRGGVPAVVRAAAWALRVYSDQATKRDVAQIKAYLAYPDVLAKRGALHAIAYMGKNVHLQPELLDAALSVEVGDDGHVASALADAFGTYGVHLSSLTRADVARLCRKFLSVQELDADQGRVPRLLNQLAAMFPDEVLEFLLARLAIARTAGNQGWKYRTVKLVYEEVSFGSIDTAARIRLANKCLDSYLAVLDTDDDYAKLFWNVAGADGEVLNLLVDRLDDNNSERVKKIAALIRHSGRRLAVVDQGFARQILRKLSGAHRESLIKSFVDDVHALPRGPFAGDPDDFWTQQNNRIREQIQALPNDAELSDLLSALHRSVGTTTYPEEI